MIVVIGDRIPPRVRGILSLWLLEPKPGVFLGSINSNVEKRLYDFLLGYLEVRSGISVYRDSKGPQGFRMYCQGAMDRKVTRRDGLTLIKKTKE
jgi:CRISPR-associated protein Cas2